MANVIRCMGSYTGRLNYMKARKLKFVLKTTNNSKYIVTQKPGVRKDVVNNVIYIYADDHFPKHKLYLFQKVKKEISEQLKIKKENGFELEDLQGKSLYNRFQDYWHEIEEGECITFDNVVEFDISKAYYNAAFLLGYITESFHKECLELPKYIRLALIGSIATKKIIYNYFDGEVESYSVTEDKELRKVWFHIVNYVDRCLFDFSKISGDNFIMYWVDGIYVKQYPAMETHLKIIENRFNLPFERIDLNKVEIERHKNANFKFTIFPVDDDEKVFQHKNKKHLFNPKAL